MQKRGEESASGSPQMQARRERDEQSCGNHAVKTTMTTAPAGAPMMRCRPFRSEAPSCG